MRCLLLLLLLCGSIAAEEVKANGWLIHWTDTEASGRNEKTGEVAQIYKQRIIDITMEGSGAKKNIRYTDNIKCNPSPDRMYPFWIHFPANPIFIRHPAAMKS